MVWRPEVGRKTSFSKEQRRHTVRVRQAVRGTHGKGRVLSHKR